MMGRMRDENKLEHSDLSRSIIGCCFDVIKELGAGFLENVYKKALFICMKEKGLKVYTDQPFEVIFRGNNVGDQIADLVVENLIIIELKCCQVLLPEHQAQLINYLKASNIPIGLLVNFGNKRLEYKRLQHPDKFIALEKPEEESIPF